MKKFYWLFWVIAISLFSFLPLLVSGYFPMHDDLQIGRLYQFDLCLRNGQIPCRWVPDMGYGYGYPLFNYYSAFPYYLGEIFHLAGVSFINSIKIVFILGFVFSGIFAYLLGKELWKELGGLVVAAFYIFLPYHAVDVYVRGALAEFWGLVFFPAVFWAIVRVVKNTSEVSVSATIPDRAKVCLKNDLGSKNTSEVAKLAFFYGLLLLSHNLMAFFFTPVVILWGLFLLWYLRKSWKILIKLALGGVWGIGLAAFFVLPVIFEKKFAHVETMFIGYFNYLAHFANIKQLFFSRFWGYGPSTWGPDDGMPFPIGQLHWLMVAISVIVFSLLWLKKRVKEVYLVAFSFFLFAFFAFLAHLRSTPIWQAIPVLAYMQFPWRFLGLASFFATILAGSIFVLIKDKNKATILAAIMILAVVVFNIPFFHPERILKITDEEKLFSAKGWNKLQTDAIFDYLPIYAERPPGGPAPEKPWFEEGEGEINDYQKGTNWAKFTAKVESEKAKIRIPIFYFPRWTIWADGKIINFDYDNELGLPTFEIARGAYQITTRLQDTPLRSASNLISLIAWIGLVGFLAKDLREKKN